MYIHVARVEYMYQLPVLHDKDWTVVDSRVAPVRERESKNTYIRYHRLKSPFPSDYSNHQILKQLLTMGSNGFSKPSRMSLRSRHTNPSTGRRRRRAH